MEVRVGEAGVEGEGVRRLSLYTVAPLLHGGRLPRLPSGRPKWRRGQNPMGPMFFPGHPCLYKVLFIN